MTQEIKPKEYYSNILSDINSEGLDYYIQNLTSPENHLPDAELAEAHRLADKGLDDFISLVHKRIKDLGGDPDDLSGDEEKQENEETGEKLLGYYTGVLSSIDNEGLSYYLCDYIYSEIHLPDEELMKLHDLAKASLESFVDLVIKRTTQAQSL